jgi:hypothetical protein
MSTFGGKDDRRVWDLQRILLNLVTIFVLVLVGLVDIFHFFVSIIFALFLFIFHWVLKDEFVMKQGKEAARMKRSTAYIDEVSDVVPA